MYAVQRGHLEVVKLLIAAHAHVNDHDDSGKTVADYALSSRNREILGYNFDVIVHLYYINMLFL